MITQELWDELLAAARKYRAWATRYDRHGSGSDEGGKAHEAIVAAVDKIDVPKRNARFARDQTGSPWIVYTHDDDRWAIGMDGHDLPMIRQVVDTRLGDQVEGDASRPHLWRLLKYIEEP